LKRQLTVVQHLVARGASLTFQDSLGNTPLHLACKYSLTDILRYFLLSPSKTSFELRNYDGNARVYCMQFPLTTNQSTILSPLQATRVSI